jgi:hypothetical protein
MSPRWGSTPRLTDRLTVSRNVIFTLTCPLSCTVVLLCLMQCAVHRVFDKQPENELSGVIAGVRGSHGIGPPPPPSSRKSLIQGLPNQLVPLGVAHQSVDKIREVAFFPFVGLQTAATCRGRQFRFRCVRREEMIKSCFLHSRILSNDFPSFMVN